MSVFDLLVDLAIRYGFQVLGAAVIVVAGVLVSRSLARLFERWLSSQATEPPLRQLLVRALRVVVMLFTLVVALDKLGFQIAPLVAGIGVAGIGVGFALQGVLGNLMAGLTIIFTKPFRVGEYVSLLGVRGVVSTVELFSTTLLHPDQSRIVIPNRKIVGEILHNFGAIRQLSLAVTVPVTTDLAEALAAATEVVAKNARVLKDPPPFVGVAQITDDTVKIAPTPWVAVADEGIADGEIYQSLVREFRARRVTIGPSAREVRVLNGGAAGVAG